MTFSSFACARHSNSDEAPWLSPGGHAVYALEVPANARLGPDAVAVVTWMLRTDPDPGDLHWKLEIYRPDHPNIQRIQVYPLKQGEALDEDNPIQCAMQAIIQADQLVAGTNQVEVTYMQRDGSEGKLKVSDIVVHFHVDK
jgi:hypothetical protein